MPANVVKSVGRVFEVLELFNQERRPLAAVDVSRKLRIPLTSTHALLKSIKSLGYLTYDPNTWSYFPSQLLPDLVEWVRSSITGEAEIIDFLSALSRATRETINLSRRVNESVEIVFGLESSYPVGVSVSMGTVMPVTGSLTGIATLATLNKPGRETFFESLKTQDPDQHAALDVPLIEGIVRDIRRTGTVTRCDVLLRGIGATCLPVVPTDTPGPLIVGIVGPSDRIEAQKKDHRRLLRELVKKYGVQTQFPLR